ncbi:hypothetical protein [Streptomyces sp. NPDC051993]|uniref:hypothetical protein n=1 Tax=Streptomyces sp. NPDC051993 TaxID=3155286 RepID=UPI003445821D
MRKNAGHAVETLVRASVAAVMNVTGENLTELAASIGLTTDTLGRRQRGATIWNVVDLGRLADHWGIPPYSLISGPSDALSKLRTTRVAEIRRAKGLPVFEPVAA